MMHTYGKNYSKNYYPVTFPFHLQHNHLNNNKKAKTEKVLNYFKRKTKRTFAVYVDYFNAFVNNKNAVNTQKANRIKWK